MTERRVSATPADREARRRRTLQPGDRRPVVPVTADRDHPSVADLPDGRGDFSDGTGPGHRLAAQAVKIRNRTWCPVSAKLPREGGADLRRSRLIETEGSVDSCLILLAPESRLALAVSLNLPRIPGLRWPRIPVVVAGERVGAGPGAAAGRRFGATEVRQRVGRSTSTEIGATVSPRRNTWATARRAFIGCFGPLVRAPDRQRNGPVCSIDSSI